MSFLKRLFGKRKRPVIIVSGLPRSGTSMMMKMLDKGGLELVTDGIREANEDNPKGYYEFERVKKLPDGDAAWLPDTRGKVVKIISALLLHLPDDYKYKVLFMRRHIDEILDSQRRMLIRRGEPTDRVDDGEMATMFEKHLRRVYVWMDRQPNLTYLDVDYNTLLRGDPMPVIRRINDFLGGDLDEQKMATVIDPSLYRQRAE
jgi:hypothetical protein